MEENQVPDFMKMAEEMLQGLPQRVAEEARNHFMKSFIKEGLRLILLSLGLSEKILSP